MIQSVLKHYLIDGLPVGGIARILSADRASIRRHLKDGGITLRPIGGSYPLGRDPVCDAVKRSGYPSFHAFVRVRWLDPVTEQAFHLGVSEKALARVYNSYRHLLASLQTSGIVLPTSQFDGGDLEQRRNKGRAS